MASDIIICFDVKTERLLKIGTTLTVCRYPSRRIVNQSLLWKRLLLLKKQNPNIRELPETQLNIHGAWYGKSGPDMVGRGPAGAWYGGCNMVWNVQTLVENFGGRHSWTRRMADPPQNFPPNSHKSACQQENERWESLNLKTRFCDCFGSKWKKHGPGHHGPQLWTGSMDPLSWTGPWILFYFIFKVLDRVHRHTFLNNGNWKKKTEIVQKYDLTRSCRPLI